MKSDRLEAKTSSSSSSVNARDSKLISLRQREITALNQAASALVQTLEATLQRARASHSGQSFDKNAPGSFTASILIAARKNQLDALLAQPENFGIPQLFAEPVRTVVRTHLVTLQTASRYPLWTKSLESLLARGESDFSSINKVSPLFQAIRSNQPAAMAAALAELGLDHQDEEGNRAEHCVAITGNHLCLPPLLQQHITLNEPNNAGQTALHLAIKHNHSATVNVLLDNNSRADLVNQDGHDAIAMAVMYGNLPLLQRLVALNVTRLNQRDSLGRNLLHLAASHNQFAILKYLLEQAPAQHLPPVDAVSSEGRSVLHYACEHDNPELIAYLHARGANLHQADTSGHLPLTYAARLGHVRVVTCILQLDDTIPAGLLKELELDQTPNAAHVLVLLKRANEQRPAPEPKQRLLRNLVFEGGSTKGIAYVGALTELFSDAKELAPSTSGAPMSAASASPPHKLADIRRIAGTSAGAIMASFIAVGFRVNALSNLLSQTSFNNFLDGPHRQDFLKAKNELKVQSQMSLTTLLTYLATYRGILSTLRADYGLFAGEFFRQWIEEHLYNQTHVHHLTFKELHDLQQTAPDKFKDLYVVATNLATGLSEVFGHETTPDLIISDAVRMSMSIPFLFKPHTIHHKLNGKRTELSSSPYYIDGGVQDNYALHVFDTPRYQEHGHQEDKSTALTYNPQTLGLRLVPTSLKQRYETGQVQTPTARPDAFVAFMLGVVNSIMNKQEADHDKSPDRTRTIYVETHEISMLDFDLSDKDQRRLLDAGRLGVQDYQRRVDHHNKEFELNKPVLISIIENMQQPTLSVHVHDNHTVQLDAITLASQTPELVYQLYRNSSDGRALCENLGLSLHTTCPAGNTALHLAIAACDTSTVERLIAARMNANLKNHLGEFPLDKAWELRKQESQRTKSNALVKRLLRAGAFRCSESTRIPLMEQCRAWLADEEDAALHQALTQLSQTPTIVQRSVLSTPASQPMAEHKVSPETTTTQSSAALNNTQRSTTKWSIIHTAPAPSLANLDEAAQLALFSTSSHEILPGLHLGDYEAWRKISCEENKRVNVAIKVTSQMHNDPSKPFYYAPVPLGVKLVELGEGLSDDMSAWPVLRSRLPAAFAAIDLALAEQQEVMVYCSQGVSRSAAVVIAYLVARHGVSVEQADNFVKTKRPQVNTNFLPGLKSIEKELQQQSTDVTPRANSLSQSHGTTFHHASAALTTSTSSSSASNEYKPRSGMRGQRD